MMMMISYDYDGNKRVKNQNSSFATESWILLSSQL